MNPNAHAPVRQLTLYRHGQARWLRHARFEGDTLDLHLPGTALDTLIKSCAVHPAPGTGTRVLGMEHDPSGQAWPGPLMPQLGRSGLLRQWLGCEVVVETEAGGLQGRVAGVETGEETGVGQPMRQKDRTAAAGQEVPDKPERHVLLLCDAEGRLHPLPLAHLRSVQPVDAAERQRLQDAMRRRGPQQDQRTLRLRLNPGAHDLAVSGLVDCEPWQVQYRARLGVADAQGRVPVQLQAWALVSNPLPEDLVGVALELLTGKPLRDQDSRSSRRSVHGSIDPMLMWAHGRDQPPELSDWAPVVLASDTSKPVQLGPLEGHAVAEPMTLACGRSTLVPLFERALQGELELVSTGGAAQRRLRLVHPGPGPLEAGPLSVSDAAGHCGSGDLGFTPEGAVLSVPFAEARGLEVSQAQTHEDSALRWRLGAGGQVCRMERVTRKTWTVENRTRRDERLVIQLPAPDDGVEWLPPALPERQGAVLRWTLDCPAGQRVSLVLSQRQGLRRTLSRPARAEELARWLQPGGTEALEDTGQRPQAEALLPLLLQDEHLTEALDALEPALATLGARQPELREALAALGPCAGDGEDAAVRLQLVRELAQATTEAGALRRQREALQAERRTLGQRLAAAWAALEA